MDSQSLTNSGNRPDGRRPILIPTIEPGASALEVALRYAEAGWDLVPVRNGTGDPNSVVSDGLKKATRDPQQLTAWFAGKNYDVLAVDEVDKTYYVPEMCKQRTRPKERRPEVGHAAGGVE